MASSTSLARYSIPTSFPAIPYKAPNNDSSEWLFHHWSRHSSIVVGHALFIHGGELNIWNGSGNREADVLTIPNQYTYGIDLSTSWEIADVVLNGTWSAPQGMNSEALWLDGTALAFYVYDGDVSGAYFSPKIPSANELWKFTPSGTTGTWEQILPQASSNFSNLVRITHGYYASGNGLGFALGGFETVWTMQYAEDRTNVDIGPTPGLIMFNSSASDQPWRNISSTSANYPAGIAMSGAAHFVPDFGPEGLLFVIGGYIDAGGAFAQTSQVTIFEPISQQWTTQVTTGKQPEPLQSQCLVGAKGDNGTYEIFMYGGLRADSDTPLAQAKVSVLSLPSFIWHAENSSAIPDTGRFYHSCSIVGQRQMMVIGGIVTSTNAQQDSITSPETVIQGTRLDMSQPDSSPQGINVFDLSSFEWKTMYNATALPYVTPKIVKDEILSKGSYPSQWSNPLVQSWFNTTSAGSNPPVQTSTSTRSYPPVQAPSNTTSAGSKESNRVPVKHDIGAIVGGVVGGVALLALVTLFLLYFRVRRIRQHPIPDKQQELTMVEPQTAELATDTRGFEYPNYVPVEMNSNAEVIQAELPNSGLVEISFSAEIRRPTEIPAHEPSNPIYEM